MLYKEKQPKQKQQKVAQGSSLSCLWNQIIYYTIKNNLAVYSI